MTNLVIGLLLFTLLVLVVNISNKGFFKGIGASILFLIRSPVYFIGLLLCLLFTYVVLPESRPIFNGLQNFIMGSTESTDSPSANTASPNIALSPSITPIDTENTVKTIENPVTVPSLDPTISMVLKLFIGILAWVAFMCICIYAIQLPHQALLDMCKQ